MPATRMTELIDRYETELIDEWLRFQAEVLGRAETASDARTQSQSREMLAVIRDATARGNLDVDSSEWARARDLLSAISRERAQQGFSPSETATFVFSLKRPLFALISREFASEPQVIATELWNATRLLDKLGLFTVEVFQKSREELIARQQQEMMELSTPVVELWNGILALPLIGTLDSARTQIVMQNLLEAIVDKSASIAIVDITGVPTVDTLVAQHLLKTVAAARLMGAECVISGIRPQIAQTIIHLGVELGTVATKATLADALLLSFRRLGVSVSKA